MASRIRFGLRAVRSAITVLLVAGPWVTARADAVLVGVPDGAGSGSFLFAAAPDRGQIDLLVAADAGSGGTVALIDQPFRQDLPGDPAIALHDAAVAGGGLRGRLIAAFGTISLPGTLALMGIAMVGLGLSIRRKDD